VFVKIATMTTGAYVGNKDQGWYGCDVVVGKSCSVWFGVGEIAGRVTEKAW